jgi:hypothetical protein
LNTGHRFEAVAFFCPDLEYMEASSTMRRLTPVILLTCLLGLVGACSTPTMEGQASAEFAPAVLYPVTGTGFTQAFVARDAQLASYRALDITPLDVSEVDIPQTLVMGTTKGDWLLTPERQRAMQKAWAGAMDKAFAAYKLAGQGAGELRIAAKITRIAPGRPTSTTIGGEMLSASSRDVVEVFVEFRLYQQDSGALLAVIRDSRTMTAVAMSRTASIGLEIMFQSWAALLHTRISGK